MKKYLVISVSIVFCLVAKTTKAQNSPFFIWGTGLDGSSFQKGAIYADIDYGFLFEAPVKDNVKLPIEFGWRGGGTSALKIISNGNIGIGTASPAEKLSVNGKIRAHEIKVETANWPDYVFTKDYHLPSLSETEQHIKDKGHLQGIPSAEEVKANGVDLGEMNAKLLKKIEELTLYLIEQDKKITELQKQNKSYKK
nr:hypothetical protein [Pedobacter panaciterrae]